MVKKQQELVVRKIPFAFDDITDPIWSKTVPEWAYMANGTSLTLPYLEPFIIRSMREAMKQISDPDLRKQAQDFNAQEGQHYQNHDRFNAVLKENGYPELAEVEAEFKAEYEAMLKKPLKWRMAYTLGFETMTLGMTDWLMKNLDLLYRDTDPVVTSFFLWHIVEETEHKNVAYDVFHHLYGPSYFARIRGLWNANQHVGALSRRAYKRMLQKDGLWGNVKMRWRVLKMVLSLLRTTGGLMLYAALPGFDPRKVKDPPWIEHWMDVYKHLEKDEIPMLDTSQPDIPTLKIAAE